MIALIEPPGETLCFRLSLMMTWYKLPGKDSRFTRDGHPLSQPPVRVNTELPLPNPLVSSKMVSWVLSADLLTHKRKMDSGLWVLPNAEFSRAWNVSAGVTCSASLC